MNDLDKIAADAAERLWDGDAQHIVKHNTAIIKSACAHAYQMGVDSMRTGVAEGEETKQQRVTSPVRKLELSNAATAGAAPERAADDFEIIEKAIGDLAESAAQDLDHYGKYHAKWYRAVKKARKTLAGLKASYNCLIMINEQRRRNYCVHSSKAVEQPEREDSGSTPDAHATAAASPTYPLDETATATLKKWAGDELKTKGFEALGEASMQWEPRPSGVFDSSGCAKIGDNLWQEINAAIAAEREQAKHYRDLFEQIREIVAPLTPTDSSKKEIIDKVRELAAMRQPQDTLKRIEELIDAYNDTDTRPAVAVLSDIDEVVSQARQEEKK